MNYYIGDMKFGKDDELYHYGRKGMKWYENIFGEEYEPVKKYNRPSGRFANLYSTPVRNTRTNTSRGSSVYSNAHPINGGSRMSSRVSRRSSTSPTRSWWNPGVPTYYSGDNQNVYKNYQGPFRKTPVSFRNKFLNYSIDRYGNFTPRTERYRTIEYGADTVPNNHPLSPNRYGGNVDALRDAMTLVDDYGKEKNGLLSGVEALGNAISTKGQELLNPITGNVYLDNARIARRNADIYYPYVFRPQDDTDPDEYRRNVGNYYDAVRREISNMNKYYDAPLQRAKDLADRASIAVEDFGESVGDKARETYDWARDGLNNAGTAINNKANETYDWVRNGGLANKANETVDWARAGLNNAGTAISNKANETADWARAGLNNAGTAISNKANETADWVRGGGLANKANETADWARAGLNNVGSAVSKKATETDDWAKKGLSDAGSAVSKKANETADWAKKGLSDAGSTISKKAGEAGAAISKKATETADWGKKKVSDISTATKGAASIGFDWVKKKLGIK